MSQLAKLVAVFGTACLVAACEAPARYPVSGEPCNPDDPVRTVDSSMTDCVPAT